MVRTRSANVVAASPKREPSGRGSSGEDKIIPKNGSRGSPILKDTITVLPPGRPVKKSLPTAKKKRAAAEPINSAMRHQKRQRHNAYREGSDAGDGDDGNASVLDAVNAFAKPSTPLARSAVGIEVVLGSTRCHGSAMGARAQVEETPQPSRQTGLGHGGNEDEEAEQDYEGRENEGYDLPSRAQGSPELGSSIVKPRQMRRIPDPYEVPDSEPPTPPPTRRTVNGLDASHTATHPKRLTSLTHDKERAIRNSSSSSGSGEVRSTVELEGLFDDDDEEEPESESIHREPPTNIPILIQTPPTVDFRHPLRIRNQILKEMRTMMGKAAWTNRGGLWEDSFEVWEEPYAVADLGKECSTAVHGLQSILKNMRNLPNLESQHQALCLRKDRLDRSMAAVEKTVQDICRSTMVRNDRDLMDDIAEYIIPRLLLTLGAAFYLGAAGSKYKTDMYLQVGTFTNFTVQYLLWITKWILDLIRPLQKLSDRVDVKDATMAEIRIVQQRAEFSDHLRQWRDEVKTATDACNDRIDRQMKADRDEAIKAERKARADEEISIKNQQWNLYARDIEERVKKQPRPLAEKWIRATQGTRPPTPSSSSSLLHRAPGSNSQQDNRNASSAAGRPSPRYFSSSATPNRAPIAQNNLGVPSSSPARPVPLPAYIPSSPRWPLDDYDDDDMEEVRSASRRSKAKQAVGNVYHEQVDRDVNDEFEELQAQTNRNKGKGRHVAYQEAEDEEDEEEEDAFAKSWYAHRYLF